MNSLPQASNSNKNRKRDFLTLKDFSSEEIEQILDIARDVKAHPSKYTDALKGKQLALLFQKTSTRTRVSFEVGINQLGGHALYLDWRTTNFTRGDIEDEIRCMSRYVDIIMARVYDHKDIETMARASSIPVINGLSDGFHPCQALADIMTIREYVEDPREIKLVFVGDAGNNVASSLIIISSLLRIPITTVCPPEYCPREDVLEWLKKKGLSDNLTITSNIKEGVEGADVIYTDTFVSMGQERESRKRIKIFQPYQVNKELYEATGKHPYIMHCLPAHRGVEITSDVLDSPTSIVFDQAENRLHAQKALLIYLLEINKLKVKPFAEKDFLK